MEQDPSRSKSSFFASSQNAIRIPTFKSPTKTDSNASLDKIIPQTREEHRAARLRGPAGQSWTKLNSMLPIAAQPLPSKPISELAAVVFGGGAKTKTPRKKSLSTTVIDSSARKSTGKKRKVIESTKGKENERGKNEKNSKVTTSSKRQNVNAPASEIASTTKKGKRKLIELWDDVTEAIIESSPVKMIRKKVKKSSNSDEPVQRVILEPITVKTKSRTAERVKRLHAPDKSDEFDKPVNLPVLPLVEPVVDKANSNNLDKAKTKSAPKMAKTKEKVTKPKKTSVKNKCLPTKVAKPATKIQIHPNTGEESEDELYFAG